MHRNTTLAAVLGVAIAIQLGASFYAAYTAHSAAAIAKQAADDARRGGAAQVHETRERINQTCQLFESSHLADVEQLRQTYRYLVALRPTERSDTINTTVLAGLPALERKAHTDSAPQFCDKPGLGLPEPDPVIPKRPRSLRIP